MVASPLFVNDQIHERNGFSFLSLHLTIQIQSITYILWTSDHKCQQTIFFFCLLTSHYNNAGSSATAMRNYEIPFISSKVSKGNRKCCELIELCSHHTQGVLVTPVITGRGIRYKLLGIDIGMLSLHMRSD